LNNKSTNIFIRELYIWFDKARKPEQSPAIKNYLTEAENTLLENVISVTYNKKTNNFTRSEKQEINNTLKNIRAKIFGANSIDSEKQTLNPV